MRILAVETSCDDTCIAIIEVLGKTKPHFKVLSDIVSSQVEIHKKWGGVYPALAKREHQRNLVPILKKALAESKLLNPKIRIQKLRLLEIKNLEKILEREPDLFKNLEKFFQKYEKPKIDLIAATTGPGLEPCLWAGVNFAKTLSCIWNLPIIPANHIESHILSNWLEIENRKLKIRFPATCLVVSGGHTQLILMKKIGSYKILGETRDDAAGECLDKIARILGLGYPGGPIISRLAAKLKSKIKNQKSKIILPRPMLNQKNFDFSFSGLKTSVLYDYKNRPKNIRNSKKYIQEISAEAQQAIIDVLISKTLRAAKEFKAKTIILGGGVSANQELRKQTEAAVIKKMPKTQCLIPVSEYCTDNALMVAMSAFFNLQNKKNWKEITANANLNIEDEI